MRFTRGWVGVWCNFKIAIYSFSAAAARVCIRKRGAEIDAGKYKFSSSSAEAASKRQRASVHFKLCFLREMLGTHSLSLSSRMHAKGRKTVAWNILQVCGWRISLSMSDAA
jgi:hypothetical protein